MAEVATINPILEICTVNVVNASFMFDGEIGDAASGINVKRAVQSSSGTGIKAFCTSAAMVWNQFAYGFNLNRKKDVPDEEERAFLWMY